MNLFARKGVIAIALSLVSLVAQADALVTLSPLPGAAPIPADLTATFVTSKELSRSPVVVREMSTREAAALLFSTEGSVWRVLQVKAPKCGKHADRQCRRLNKECDSAKKFVKKNGGHAACSTLYVDTTVLLSNDKQNPLRILGE